MSFSQLILDKECADKKALESDEKFKNLVEWMQIIVTSTRPASTVHEDDDFSNEGIQRLKTRVNFPYVLKTSVQIPTDVVNFYLLFKIAASITQSRENAQRIEELQGNLATKDMHISHLRSIISKLGWNLKHSTETGVGNEREENVSSSVL